MLAKCNNKDILCGYDFIEFVRVFKGHCMELGFYCLEANHNEQFLGGWFQNRDIL